VVGAIILSSLAWTSLHLQYDWFFFGEVFCIGLLLGYPPLPEQFDLADDRDPRPSIIRQRPSRRFLAGGQLKFKPARPIGFLRTSEERQAEQRQATKSPVSNLRSDGLHAECQREADHLVIDHGADQGRPSADAGQRFAGRSSCSPTISEARPLDQDRRSPYSTSAKLWFWARIDPPSALNAPAIPDAENDIIGPSTGPCARAMLWEAGRPPRAGQGPSRFSGKQ